MECEANGGFTKEPVLGGLTGLACKFFTQAVFANNGFAQRPRPFL